MNFKCMKIEGFKNYYITSLGEVYSSKRKEILRLTPKTDRLGYLHQSLYQERKAHYISIHREVAKAFIENNNKNEVNHIDGDKSNNSVSNLEWCTRSENIKHAYKTKLKTNKGDVNPSSKLSNDDIPNIRALIKKGLKDRDIALNFNVTHHTIYKIRTGKQWGSV